MFLLVLVLPVYNSCSEFLYIQVHSWTFQPLLLMARTCLRFLSSFTMSEFIILLLMLDYFILIDSLFTGSSRQKENDHISRPHHPELVYMWVLPGPSMVILSKKSFPWIARGPMRTQKSRGLSREWKPEGWQITAITVATEELRWRGPKTMLLGLDHVVRWSVIWRVLLLGGEAWKVCFSFSWVY